MGLQETKYFPTEWEQAGEGLFTEILFRLFGVVILAGSLVRIKWDTDSGVCWWITVRN